MANMEREHKNNIFCMICRDRKNLLSIYNAVNGSDYTDETALKVVTLESAILLRMHNDAAFIIDQRLNIYEQQASINPNMPLRDLYYVVEEFKRHVPMREIYGRRRVKLPAPRFIIFYNGREEQPPVQEYRLSELFEVREEKPSLELIVKQININKGCNEALLERCESLKGYMTFVDKVRSRKDKGIRVEQAVAEAVEECIREGVLAEFFRTHKSEVISMGIYDFNEEEWEEVVREESYEEGLEAGKTVGRVEGLAEGKAEAVISILSQLGDVPEDLMNRIHAEKELDRLKKWILCAAKAESIEDFLEEME